MQRILSFLLLLAWVSLIAGVLVAVIFLVKLVAECPKPSDFYSAFSEFLLVAVLGIEGLLALGHFKQAQKDAKEEERKNIKEATLPFFRAWWGVDQEFENEKREKITLIELRTDFYKLVGQSNKNPDQTTLAELAKLWRAKPEDGGGFGLGQTGQRLKELMNNRSRTSASEQITDINHLYKLTLFYDMIGWLGAHGLIDVNYILGPMQHQMRRTWWVTKVLIEKDRELRPDYRLDPVRHLGFEWLFEYSEEHKQVDIIESRFSRLPGVRAKTIQQRKQEINADEVQFKNYLREAGWQVDDGDEKKSAVGTSGQSLSLAAKVALNFFRFH